jgi:germination protein M
MTRRIVLVAFALVTALAASCGDDGSTGGSSTASGPSSTTSALTTSTTATTSPAAGTMVPVRVYFAADEAIATAGRVVRAPAVARGALDALLAGPEDVEIEIGQTSEIPDGTDLLDVDIADGLATVDLTGEFEAGGGSLSMQLRVAQVVFTLTQFETVDSVDFSIDGSPVDAIGGEGVPAVDVDRSDFAGVTPLVLVESPVPGESVTSPLEITGMANTFEATVNYAVTDGEGLIVDEGFTTATAGNGTFGTFSVTSEFLVDRAGVGSVIGFEVSARDGTQVSVYEVPVEIG